MIGLETDPFMLWAIRGAVYLLLLLVAALIAQLLWAVVKGDLYLPDVLTGPSGRLSWKKIGGVMMTGAVAMAVMRDAADGTLSWELAAVALVAAGMIDVAGGALNEFANWIKLKNGGGNEQAAGTGKGASAGGAGDGKYGG